MSSSFTFSLTCAPCCNTCTGTATMTCRTRGGTASLCGYSEWSGHASTPPKKYRLLTMGGGYVLKQYTDSGCLSHTGVDVACNWSGTCTYNAATCGLTTGAVQNCGGADAPQCASPDLGSDFAIGGSDSTTTSKDWNAILSGICRSGFGHFYKYTTANQFAHLTVEDTEADALARLLAGAGGTWSAYSAASSTTCLARWEQRTSGFSFVYQEAGWKLHQTGLTPSTPYYAYVQYYRRVFGVGGYTLLQTDTVSGTTDGAGILDITGDVPNLEGYETYAVFPGSCP